MIYLFNKIKNRILCEFHKIFPTHTQKELLRWYKDGGDYNLRFNYPLNSSVGPFASSHAPMPPSMLDIFSKPISFKVFPDNAA